MMLNFKTEHSILHNTTQIAAVLPQTALGHLPIVI